MRFWRTGDSGILVEHQQGRFVQFARAGDIVAVYGPWGTSDQETIYRKSYEVQGTGLVEWTDVEPDRAADYRYASDTKLTGLAPIAAEDCWVPLDGLDSAIARFQEERRRRVLSG